MEVLDITNPQFNEQISPVPWQFIKSRFHCTRLGIQMVNKFPTVLFVCMLKNLWRGIGTSVNRQDFKLSVPLYLAQQLCCSPLNLHFLGPISSQLFCDWAMYHYFLLVFNFPTNPVWLCSSTDITQCQTWVKYSLHKKWSLEVADPDLQIRRGGHPHPKIKDVRAASKKTFLALWA